jgi:hypothetical protein
MSGLMEVSYSYTYTPEYYTKIADESDLPVVADFWVQLVKSEYPDAEPNKEAWIDRITGMMKTGKYVCVIAYHVDTPVGFGDFYFNDEPATGKLHSVGQHFYILPVYRKGQAGHMIYKLWKKTAKNLGAEILELRATESNEDMWNRAGFKPKEVIMWRNI